MRKLALSDEILMKVDKPARYIGNEFNSVMKDTSQVNIRFAMCFPDVYEIGMSHLGIQILYDMFNRMDDVWCERVYSPWPDLHEIMKQENIPLFGLESQEPIKDFDFVAMTLQYEMCYTNILQILYLIGPSGNATTVETNLPILDLDVSSSGIAVAALQDDATIYLRMFSATGDVISEIKTSMQKSGYPLAFSISPDNIKVGVSYLKAEGGKINTSLAFYNFGDVGQNETDNLVSGYDYAGELFPLLFYPNEDNALAVGDKRVLILKGKQKPTLQTEIELDDEVQSVFYNGTNFALVFRNTEQDGGYSIRVYDMNGRKKMTETIDFEYMDLIVENDRILVYNQNQLVIYGLNGVKKYEGELGGTIRAIVPTSSDTKLLVVLEDSIQLIKLR